MSKFLFKSRMTTALSAALVVAAVLVFPSVKVSAHAPTTEEIAENTLELGAFSTFKYSDESSEDTDEAVYDTAKAIRPSCVQLYVGDNYGSGSIYSIEQDKIYILTAKHVLKNWDNASRHLVIFYDGLIKNAELVTESKTHDIAVLCVNTDDIPPYDLIHLKKVNIGASDLNKNSENNINISSSLSIKSNDIVLAMDSKYSANPEANQFYNTCGTGTGIAESYIYGPVLNTDIMVTDFGYNMLYSKCTAHEGMSGSGVFDTHGNYIALLAGGSEKNEMVAIKLQDIIDFLHRQ